MLKGGFMSYGERDFCGRSDGWGPCFCPACNAEAEKERIKSEAREREFQEWADRWNVELSGETEAGMSNMFSLYETDGPRLHECLDCEKRYIGEKRPQLKKETPIPGFPGAVIMEFGEGGGCPYCGSTNKKLIKWFRPSEVP